LASLADIVITADRSMMTNHRGKEFLGFMTTAPAVLLPEALWKWISMPKLEVDELGRPVQAPYGLRKVEAALKDAGISAEVVDPDHVAKYVKGGAKAVFVGHHDYFAYNAPSNEYWLVTGKEPINRRTFLSFVRKLCELKKKHNPSLKVVVGGPAAWQWLYAPEFLEEFGVDVIVEGEGEKAAVELAKAIIEGKELPRFVMVGPSDVPRLEEIPTIKGASVNGLIEIMRGCPRRCSFCPVTLRPLRHYTLEMVEAELRVNAESGVKSGILHSDDVPLYGSSGVEVNMDALLKLHALAKKYYEEVSWSHATCSTVLYGEKEHKMVTKVAELLLDGGQLYVGLQTGIETGSPRLAERIMPGKAAPFSPRDWPEVVKEAFAIMHEAKFIPAATLILGLPGETPDDVLKTIELVDELKPYRSLIVPMFFVPMGALRSKEWFTSVKLTIEHAELMLAAMRHSAYWAEDIVKNFYLRGLAAAPARLALLWFVRAAKKFSQRVAPEKVLEYIERSRAELLKWTAKREALLQSLKSAAS